MRRKLGGVTYASSKAWSKSYSMCWSAYKGWIQKFVDLHHLHRNHLYPGKYHRLSLLRNHHRHPDRIHPFLRLNRNKCCAFHFRWAEILITDGGWIGKWIIDFAWAYNVAHRKWQSDKRNEPINAQMAQYSSLYYSTWVSVEYVPSLASYWLHELLQLIHNSKRSTAAS